MEKIFDVIRGKYVALTPEEVVRQQFVNFLIHEKGYPQSLLANEIELHCGNKKMRCDTVVYKSVGLMPVMIVEYKAPQIEISQSVFNQILDYNSILKVPYLVMFNGNSFLCCKTDCNGNYVFLNAIPEYKEL